MDGQKIAVGFVVIAIFTLAVLGIFKLYQRQTASPNPSPTTSSVGFETIPSTSTSPSPSPLVRAQPVTGDEDAIPNLGIAVQGPVSGDTIFSPVNLTGLANTQYTNVAIIVKDAYGTSLGEGQATACFSKSPCSFYASVVFKKPATKNGTIEVFSRSPKDGSKKYLQTIPVGF